MQDNKFSCLVFVRVEKQRFEDANFSGEEIILTGQYFANVLSMIHMGDPKSVIT